MEKMLKLFVLLTQILVGSTFKILFNSECYSCLQDECYSCSVYFNETLYSKTIKSNTRYIKTDLVINYSTFLNKNIKLIEDPSFITVYECPHNTKFSQYFKHNYSKVNSFTDTTLELDLPVYQISISTSNTLQNCLRKFCAKNELYFECVNDTVQLLDLTFDAQITVRCVQRITFAFIKSSKITKINDCVFLEHAIHLIRLRIDTAVPLHVLGCNHFSRQQKMVILELPKYNQHYNTLCFFEYNQNLVKIELLNGHVWNLCNGFIQLVANNSSYYYFHNEINSKDGISANDSKPKRSVSRYVTATILFLCVTVGICIGSYKVIRYYDINVLRLLNVER